MNQQIDAINEPFATPRGFPRFDQPAGENKDRAWLAKQGLIASSIATLKAASAAFASSAEAFKSGRSSLQDVMKAFGKVAGALGVAERVIQGHGELPQQVIDLVREQRRALVEVATQAAEEATSHTADLKGQTASMDAFLEKAGPRLNNFVEFYAGVQNDLEENHPYPAPGMRH